jgi:hypothetical protein
MAKSYVELTWEEYEELKSYEPQLLEILDQLDDVRDRSERYREALLRILAGENDPLQIVRIALERA